MKFKNLVGETFGRLTVLKLLDRKGNNNRDLVYLCACKCLNEVEVEARHLRDGKTRSCGCLAQETRSDNGKLHKIEDRDSVLYKGLFAKFKNDLKHRGRTFSISLDEFIILSSNKCFYCGRLPNNEFTYTYSGEKLLYNGIDRFDNDKEYDIDNLVTACWKCNSAKNNMSIEEFVSWINDINNNFVKTETFIELTTKQKKEDI